MATFSERYDFSHKGDIVEEAPNWLRTVYLQEVLSYFIVHYSEEFIDLEFVDMDFMDLFHEGILYPSEIEAIKIKLRNDFPNAKDLFDIIRACEWHEFYSIIEIIGDSIMRKTDGLLDKYSNLTHEYMEKIRELSARVSKTFSELTPENIEEFRILPRVYSEGMEFSWIEKFQSTHYNFQIYRNKVNSLFEQYRVGWTLDKENRLKRITPKILESELQKIGDELISSFEPAYVHFQKASKYTFRIPLDPENSVKEIVSALESLGNTLYPHQDKELPLSAIVREMRKRDILPERLLDVMQAFYHYACDEPGIRHGKSEPSLVKLEDAEFCLHLGAALIHYMITSHGYQDKKEY